MRAVKDFTASINGADYALKKGEEFKGDAVACERLKEMGLLEEKKAAVEGKKAKDER